MKKTILDQLMGLRMNSVMNEITNSDMEYQEIIRKSDIYSNKLEALQLPKETRLLIDRYVSEQNALGSRYGMLAYQLGFSDCKELFIERLPFSNIQAASPRDEV
ncbi:MAG: hypothetical protein OSJ72_18360 [Lachnospiraceae bacterium]|nr:hypothetical protein [Lachnospiraceae bacterium]